jgi:hypothetical protein
MTEMTARLRTLGILVGLIGLAFVVAGGYSFWRAQEGQASLNAFSAAQNVQLSYNDAGQLTSAGETAEADAIMSLLTDDWGYPVNMSEFDPNDPIVNTASEYMYQMATINYHILHSTVQVTLTEPAEYNGETFAAGTYDFPVDGRYYSEFDRAHPIEGPARGIAWSPTALGLIGQLGVGTVTASALEMGLGLAAAFGAVGVALLFLGVGMIWVTRAKTEEVVATQPALAPMPTA